MQTVASTESFNSGIHLQRKPDGNKQGCCFSNCFVSDRDPRLFLTVTVLVFITHVLSWNFPNELCQACQNCIPALLLSWRYATASSRPPQAAKSSCGLLTSQADSHPLLQSVCNTEPQSQRQRATKKKAPRTSPPTPCTWLRKRGAHLISGSVAAFEVLNQFFSTYHGLLTDWHLWSQQPVQTSVTAIINEPSHITAVFPSTI